MLNLSPKFLGFLEDYARSIGKDPSRIIEEAVSQAILRHTSPEESAAHGHRVLMPREVQKHLLTFLSGFDPRNMTETHFGDLMERLPDKNWTYQVARLDGWWFLVISMDAGDLPEPIEVRSVETSQAYVWLFSFPMPVRLWSDTNRFLVVF